MIGLNLIAQTDTFRYYDFNWMETTRDRAKFYRIVEKSDGRYHVKDYYISGALQMEGVYISLDPDIQNGYFVWYFENGQKSAEGAYKYGTPEGIWTFWFPDGLKREEIRFLPKGEYVSLWRSALLIHAEQLVQKAQIRKKWRNLRKARLLLDKAIQICPYCPEAYYERGLLSFSEGKTQDGCQDLLLARQYGYYDPETLNKRLAKHCKVSP
ncbi:MAG: hypothetical protein KatS3mg031_0091 [Chitinophagales bacterium]|nr:MAG: hypothetical protein KatS3mg031_0091 [Chitinophagales bacterium]